MTKPPSGVGVKVLIELPEPKEKLWKNPARNAVVIELWLHNHDIKVIIIYAHIFSVGPTFEPVFEITHLV